VIATLNGSGTSSSLQALSAAQKDIAVSQRHVSTGLKVADARDDGATASIATHVKTQIVEQSVLRDNRMRMRSLLDVTQSSVENITGVLTEMKEKALALQDTSLDTASRNALTNDLAALSKQIDEAAAASSFNGQNLLVSIAQPTYYPLSNVTNASSQSNNITIPASDVTGTFYLGGFGQHTPYLNLTIDDGSGPQTQTAYGLNWNGTYTGAGFDLPASVTPTSLTISVAASGGGIAYLSGASYFPVQDTSYFPVEPGGNTLPVHHTGMSAAALGVDNLQSLSPIGVLARVDQALRLSITTADYYGGKSNLVDTLIRQGDAQTETLQKGLGDLVDADMTREAATLQARQSREQLAEQSLAISNQAPKMLLKLFAH